MSRIVSNSNVFESRMKILRHAASRYPARVGRVELSRFINGSARTHQRTLSELVELGYLDCDDCNPRGYRLITDKFKDFQGL